MSYSSYILTEKPLLLAAPDEYSATGNQMTSVMSFDVQNNGAKVGLPLYRNYGESFTIDSPTSSKFPFSLMDTKNSPVATVNPGEVYSLFAAPEPVRWKSIKLTGKNVNTSANALAGIGLKVLSNNTLNVVVPTIKVLSALTIPAYTVTENDLGALFLITDGSVKLTVNKSFYEGFYFSVNVTDIGASLLISNGNSSINVNRYKRLTLTEGACASFVSSGNDYYLQTSSYNALQSSNKSSVYSTIIVPGATHLNLTPSALSSQLLSFSTGTVPLNSNYTVYLGNDPGIWAFNYSTIDSSLSTASFKFSVGTSASAGSQTPISFKGGTDCTGFVAIQKVNGNPVVSFIGRVSNA